MVFSVFKAPRSQPLILILLPPRTSQGVDSNASRPWERVCVSVFTCKESLAIPSTARRWEDLDMNSNRASFLLRQYRHTAVIENARTRIGRNGSDSKVILVFPPAVLGYPKHHRGEHQPDVLRDVAVAVVLVHLGVVVHNVLEDQDALEKCRVTRVRRMYRTRGWEKTPRHRNQGNYLRRFQRDLQPSTRN